MSRGGGEDEEGTALCRDGIGAGIVNRRLLVHSRAAVNAWSAVEWLRKCGEIFLSLTIGCDAGNVAIQSLRRRDFVVTWMSSFC